MTAFAQSLLILAVSLCDMAYAPRLYHVERFTTDRSSIREMLTFNRTYKINISSVRDTHPNSELVATIEKECDDLWKAWDSLDDAKNEMFSVMRRRHALGVLMKCIGPESFQMGLMPPHVPYWRFSEVRNP